MWLFLLLSLIVLGYLYTTRNFKYWANRNVKHDAPWPLFGNHFPVFSRSKSDVEMYVYMYQKYRNESLVGYYRLATPVLIVKDPEIIKRILSTDFIHFHARGIGGKPETEPLMLNLAMVDGDYWRLLRQRIPSAFANNKIQNMFPLITGSAKRITSVIENCVIKGNKEVDACTLMRRYTIEVIAECGFGINMNTIDDEESQFLKLGDNVFIKSKWQTFLLVMKELFPELLVVQNVNFFDKKVSENFIYITEKVREQRNYKPSGRNDFMDLLLEMEKLGKISGESFDLKNPDGTSKRIELKMNLPCIAAQVFIFFVAGFETSATASSFVLHMLAFNPDVQKKVQAEIDTVLKKYNGVLCYDAVCEMTQLEMAFNEAQRIFPPVGEISRVCTKRYNIPNTDVTIDPGVRIIIPSQAIHMDPKYYENPTEFKPERFSSDSIKNRNKYVYLPFGEGPRKCVGVRFGMIQSLTGIAAILQRFTVEPGPTSRRQHQINRASIFVQDIHGGLPVRFKHRS